ncbi:MAG: uroporphyrinogen-III C-methyltransferase [bacterium]|nr:uroporphyrinogen-III C-methyltransferase [bacterium]
MLLNTSKENKVYLVGSGPGNPYLMTIRGQDLLKNADVIVYDYLANDVLLDLASPETEKIYVGKQAGDHTKEQDEINKLLVQKAQDGKNVVRLKGGDPFVFGRGGEEAEYLKEHGVKFEIVPGITSATAALAYAGIPLTHRGLASAASIITGHEDPEKDNSDINWQALAAMNGTLVFFMGVRRLPFIIRKLIENGKSGSTPAALIKLGTLPQQQTVTGTLDTIVNVVKESGISPPALIVIGEVVKMRDKLQWFESLPLFGRSIIVTRSHNQTREFTGELSILGAEVIHRPAIDIIPPESYSDLDECLQKGGEYDWIIFTSVNGVRAFAHRINELDLDIRIFTKAKFGAIGSMSGKAVRELGVKVDFVPENYTSTGFVTEFKEKYSDLSGSRILIPASDLARDIIPDGLSDLGAEVIPVTAYRTAAPAYSKEDMRSLFIDRMIDLVTFTSSSTVDNFFLQFSENDLEKVKSKLNAASIGPMTSDTLREHGIEPVLEAEIHTVKGLTGAIIEYFNNG